MKFGKPLLLAALAIAAGPVMHYARADVTLTTIHTFDDFNNIDGTSPSSLVQGSDGNFYGTTFKGGAYSKGTVFKMTPAGMFTTLHSFTGGDDGGYGGILRRGKDGDLYGATGSDIGVGGTIYGTVFRITTQGTLTTLYTFSGGDDGTAPADLIQGTDGDFHGTTQIFPSGSGEEFLGTVFKLTPDGVLTNLYSFTGGSDGFGPGSLVQGKDGNFYGATAGGGYVGDTSYGTVFSITPQGTLTTLYTFTGGDDGAYPFLEGLEQGGDGNFYGATTDTGDPSYGTVFRITTQGTLTTLYTFTGGVDGSSSDGLMQLSDGSFYGTTYGVTGTTDDSGTVFKLTTAGTLTTLYQFCGVLNCLDGSHPVALTLGNDGSLYGMTKNGGTNNDGTTFKFSVDGGLGGTCVSSINPTSKVFAAMGGSGSVSVTTSNGCAWTAISNDSFITITSVKNGSGDGVVNYSVTANTTASSLTGTMTIAGQTVMVTQTGEPACNFNLSATNAAVAATGSLGTVDITTSNNCVWTAVSNDGFITITSGSGGTGNGTVRYSITANTSTNGRAGTMTIAGQSFTVTQSGEIGRASC